MKNVYLYILFLLIGGKSLGQNLQNANWLFGDHAGINFLPNPATPNEITYNSMNTHEACASVSDHEGELLFYTNGVDVWNKNHQTMPNGHGLLSHLSSTQGAIIVPRPGCSGKYYIFTISGITNFATDSSLKGLHFSEVDMSLDGGLGDIIVSTKNIPLKDHNLIDIDPLYVNASEKLTSALHANGTDYWVITQIKDHIYSYLISSSGVSISPYTVSLALNTILVTNQSGVGQMKISPDGQRIGICYNQGVNNNSSTGGVVLGAFNNSTGQIALDVNKIIPSGLVSPYSIEFSPNSQYVFFTSFGKLFYTSSTTATLYSQTINGIMLLQRSLDDKIYFDSDVSTLSRMNNPNDIMNLNIQSNIIDVSPGNINLSLPQWVYVQLAQCVSDLVLTSANNVLVGIDNREVSNTIIASNIVSNGATANYDAGLTVELTHGFHSSAGSKLRAYIDGCEGECDSPPQQPPTNSLLEILEGIEKIILSPNPATESVSIKSDKLMTNITVTSMQGVVLFNRDVRANNYELNISNYIKGFYVVTVTTEDGQTETQKLIKE